MASGHRDAEHTHLSIAHDYAQEPQHENLFNKNMAMAGKHGTAATHFEHAQAAYKSGDAETGDASFQKGMDYRTAKNLRFYDDGPTSLDHIHSRQVNAKTYQPNVSLNKLKKALKKNKVAAGGPGSGRYPQGSHQDEVSSAVTQHGYQEHTPDKAGNRHFHKDNNKNPEAVDKHGFQPGDQPRIGELIHDVRVDPEGNWQHTDAADRRASGKSAADFHSFDKAQETEDRTYPESKTFQRPE